MSILASDLHFPNNVISLCAVRFQLLDSDLYVFKRPLRSTDPVQSIGVFGSVWMPDVDSFEMKGAPPGLSEPTIQQYIITIQAFVKDMEEERGFSAHSVMSKMIRTMLYRDEPLRVGLRSLSSSMMGSVERLQRVQVRNQRFNSNELSGNWLYLSTLEMLIETETI